MPITVFDLATRLAIRDQQEVIIEGQPGTNLNTGTVDSTILPILGAWSNLDHQAWSIGFATVGVADWQIKDRLSRIFGAGPGVFWLSVRRASLAHILDHFVSHRHPGYRYPQLAPLPVNGSTLYVGQTSNLEARLLEHLTHSDAQREALHLDTWAQGVHGILCVDAVRCDQAEEADRIVVNAHLKQALRPLWCGDASSDA
ncbi:MULTISPECIES: hypothetical protein [unclassified Chelatococcus]|uniref:hypothetical protein n=1 Tax=unclassified Chelatococcus TaxID=2638111 RepID=UPI001BCE8820|nr:MULTISPECIES: hypothetical protein [unclassified Chelatococcus]MBS7743723.1 hypothetical protein [Chelatococcus sp. HY11]MBX3547435.1 hypothetical protein [Chelatococcus sp.]CAH1664650.1 conserved hypothetical protein [Hyphomicrobiales bacterium]CAH1688401.1 conserved hypothetical protein [Hyphomicrobiales bacterium]